MSGDGYPGREPGGGGYPEIREPGGGVPGTPGPAGGTIAEPEGRPVARKDAGFARPELRSALTVVDGAIALATMLLIVQMWLLTAALEAYLGGHHAPVVAGAAGSAALFAGLIGLHRFVSRVDREARKGRAHTRAPGEPA